MIFYHDACKISKASVGRKCFAPFTRAERDHLEVPLRDFAPHECGLPVLLKASRRGGRAARERLEATATSPNLIRGRGGRSFDYRNKAAVQNFRHPGAINARMYIDGTRPGPTTSFRDKNGESALCPRQVLIPDHCPVIAVLRGSDAARGWGLEQQRYAESCVDPVRGSASACASGDGMTRVESRAHIVHQPRRCFCRESREPPIAHSHHP